MRNKPTQPTGGPAFPCPYCGRTNFANQQARFDHARNKHRGMPLRDIMPDTMVAKAQVHAAEQRERRKREREWRREPSLADIAVEATIKQAMGELLDELEWSLLP